MSILAVLYTRKPVLMHHTNESDSNRFDQYLRPNMFRREVTYLCVVESLTRTYTISSDWMMKQTKTKTHFFA